MRPRAFLPSVAAFALAVATVGLPSSASTEPRPEDSSAAKDGSEQASALAWVAARLGKQIAADATGARVFVAPLRSDEPSPRANELVARMATLVGGAIAGSAGVHADPVPLATAHTLSRQVKRFVYVQPEVQRGELRATADVFTVASNVWDRARQLAPVPVAHAFASERIDAEVRGYLLPIPLLTGQVERVQTDEPEILAVACADADGDGTLELVTLSRYRAALGRARGGRFVPSSEVVLRDVSPIAAAPLREPVASIVVVSPGREAPARIDVGISDRALGARFSPELRRRGSIAGVPFPTGAGDVCARFEGTVQSAVTAPCDAADPRISEHPAPGTFDAVFEAEIVTAAGATRRVRAQHNPWTNELDLASDAARATIAHAGAQVVVADLDADGDPEIVSSLDVLPLPSAPSIEKLPERGPDLDALVVSTWRPGAAPQERLRVPVPMGVRAIAACPPDGPGSTAVVLATGAELWVIR